MWQRQYRVLIVDDEPNNLKVLQQTLKDYYQLLFATNGEKALLAANKHLPDLILLDIMMPGMSGHDVCIALKQNELTRHIPVIFVTALSDVESEAYGFDIGAVDYIQKPISPPIVQRRVATHLSLLRAERIEQFAREAIQMLGESGHYNDNDTGSHIWRMAAYSSALAKKLGWSDEHVEMLGFAAPMHDMGKIGIPHDILKAPRPLNAEEWEQMRKHATIGFEILSLSQFPIFKLAAEIALHHHEKWDGSGYPKGLSGKSIPESARIVAIADVFDALTMKRAYKEPWSFDEAMKYIQQNSGSHFDPEFVEAFVQIVPELIKIKDEWSDDSLE